MFYINKAHNSYNLIKEDILSIHRYKISEEPEEPKEPEESEESEIVISFKSFYNKDEVDFLTIETFEDTYMAYKFIEWLSLVIQIGTMPVYTFDDFSVSFFNKESGKYVVI